MQKMMDMDIILPVGSAEAYVQRVFGVPVLSKEEERDLAIRLKENNDLEAARKLVLSQLRYVVYIARGYSGYGLAQADLIQEGNIGLMKAVKRFDPSMNVRLVSFAVHWIRAEMHEFILKNWRIVKVATTKAQRKLFFNLRSSKKRLGWFSKDEVDAVASDLGVKPETVLEMEARMSHYDVCFDPLVDDNDPDMVTTPASYLTEPKQDPATYLESQNWDAHKTEKLTAALGTLNDRSRDIIERRWLAEKKTTLHELAAVYQVSAERIRQIENSAMKKLKTVFEL